MPEEPDAITAAAPRASDRLWRVALTVAYRLMLAWWFLRRPDGDGVHVAVWHEGRLLLIRNSYRAGVTVPSGGIHRGEKPLDAARRELREEVGIEVSPDELVAACEFVVPFEYKSDHGYVFELHCDTEPEIRIDQREVVWGAFVPRDEIERLSRLSPHLRRYLEQQRPAA